MVKTIKNSFKKRVNDDVSRKKSSIIVNLFHSLFGITDKAPAPTAAAIVPPVPIIPINPLPSVSGLDNLIKMGEARKILKASAPTVRKYARMGCYKEYRFGEKLVFYDKQEILNFILSKGGVNEKASPTLS